MEPELLRFTTAGGVDDGKSTLIGRLLHDANAVYEDQLNSVRRASPGHLDFAFITDGLHAEREQGITIDVAYRYFSTPRRRFIVADTPDTNNTLGIWSQVRLPQTWLLSYSTPARECCLRRDVTLPLRGFSAFGASSSR